jgi:SsrA-binding protein
MADKNTEHKVLATNKKAYHEFTIIQKNEAGISLLGTEVKSIRAGNINLKDGYAFIKSGEVFLKNVHISQYPFGNRINHEPVRDRKLLLHREEIRKLHAKIREKGYTLVPLRVYIKDGKVKVELGLVRGKRLYNKKDDIRKRDESRELRRSFKSSNLSGRLK